jgi:hypothetical protein
MPLCDCTRCDNPVHGASETRLAMKPYHASRAPKSILAARP